MSQNLINLVAVQEKLEAETRKDWEENIRARFEVMLEALISGETNTLIAITIPPTGHQASLDLFGFEALPLNTLVGQIELSKHDLISALTARYDE